MVCTPFSFGTPITIGITVILIFHSFIQFPRKVLGLISEFAFLRFNPVVNRNFQAGYSAGSLFLLTITRSRRLVEIWWSVCISKSRELLGCGVFDLWIFLWECYAFIEYDFKEPNLVKNKYFLLFEVDDRVAVHFPQGAKIQLLFCTFRIRSLSVAHLFMLLIKTVIL